MGKTGFLFPGQGAQFPEMGKDLYEAHEEVRALYDLADSILPASIRRISFDGTAEELKLTKNTQPAIFIHSLAVHALFTRKDIRPDMVAGHSVGEYSALTVAGAIEFPDALRLVHLRSILMYEAGLERSGTMAAIIGLDREHVYRVCEEASSAGIVSPANFNSPVQTVISGDEKAIGAAIEIARREGARKAVPLNVSGAFHSALMEPASRKLNEEIDRTSIRSAEVPVLSNALGRVVTDAGEIRESLKKQLGSPVLWTDDIGVMIEKGCDLFVEIGPGNVLKGLLRRISREVTCYTTGSLSGTEDAMEMLRHRSA